MDSDCALLRAGAMSCAAGIARSPCAGPDCCTSTTLPKVSTKMKCSATLIVKKRDRPSRPINAPNATAAEDREKKKRPSGGSQVRIMAGAGTPGKRNFHGPLGGTLTPGKN